MSLGYDQWKKDERKRRFWGVFWFFLPVLMIFGVYAFGMFLLGQAYGWWK